MAKDKFSPKKDGLELKEKVEHLLEEVRIVLPGTQVLLGFQFTAIFSNGFDNLSSQLQNIHLVSLGFILLAIVFIMIPPSFHRIADHGDDTERFHTISSYCIVAALFTLALGIAADVFVVMSHVVKSDMYALISAIAVLLVAYSAWFIFPLTAQQRSR